MKRMTHVLKVIDAVLDLLADAPRFTMDPTHLRERAMKRSRCSIEEYQHAVQDLSASGMVRFSLESVRRIA